MDNLTVDEIINGLNSGDLRFEDIKDTLNKLSPVQIEDIALRLNNDEDKMKCLPYTFRQIKIIKSFSSEESTLKALKFLRNDKDKLKVIVKFLKSDNARIEGIKEIQDEDFKFLAKIVLSREGLKDDFLPEARKYTEMGLDKKITVGMEIETEGSNCRNIIEVARNNGEVINRKQSGSEEIEMSCGTILKNDAEKGDRAWKVSEDSSLIDGGLEAISPILTDSKEDVEDIYMVCSMLKDEDVTKRCGGHIHIGSDYLTSKEAYANLFEIFGNTEEILYIISNEPGTIPREDVR